MSRSITSSIDRATWPRDGSALSGAIVVAVLAGACRFGGPSGDPTAPVVSDAASAGGSAGQAGSAGGGGTAQGGSAGESGGGSGGASGGGGTSNPGGSGGGIADASRDIADNDATIDADARSLDVQLDTDDVLDGEAPDSAPPTVCAPPFSSAVCDPVCNTGCTALLRCDTTDTPRTGVCVGTLLSTVTEGMPCTRSAVTDDCAERLSCVEGTCRRLCYRDTDCTTSGTCCNTALDVDAGPTGYRTCALCMP